MTKLALAFTSAALLVGAQAAGQPPPTLSVEIGFHGRYLPNHDVPIRVLVEYEGLPQDGELLLRQESRRALSSPQVVELRRSIRLSSRAKQQYELYFPLTSLPPPEGSDPELVVQLLASSGRVLAAQTVDLSGFDERDPLVLLISEADYPRVLPTGERVEQVDVERLPRDWRGYAGVARLYLGRVNVGRMSSEQQRALARWLAGGGTLVVLTGENFYLQDDPWLRELLPVQIEDVREIAVARARPNSETLLREGELPLVVRGRFNQGWIYFSALDLSGRDEGERVYWEQLAPPAPTRTEEGSPALGTELFQTMELYSPSRTVLTGLLATYLIGIGLLSLWVIRRSRRYDAFGELVEPAEEDRPGEGASGWRVLALLLGWVLLTLAGALTYMKQPAFASQAQSLEIGILWGEADSPWMKIQSWYNVIIKRPTSLELTSDRDAKVVPLTGLSLRSEPDRQRIRFFPREAAPWEQRGLFLEEIRPRLVRVRIHAADVRIPQFQVYNESSWPLLDVVLRKGEIYYGVGDLPPGAAREASAGGTGNRAWPSLLLETARFEDRLKLSLFREIEREIGAESEDWILLAWIPQESLERAPGEHRLIWKLLVIRIPEGG